MIYNYRQLAEGQLTIDGFSLRPNLFVHSAYMEPIPEHRDFLEDAGIETVFDFRSSHEIQAKPNFVTITVNYYPLAKEFIQENNSQLQIIDMVKFYRDGFEYCPYLKSAIRDIVLHPRKILYHSSAGKDRTGIFSIILMCILGYSIEDIKAHYLEIDSLLIEYSRDEMKSLAIDVNAQMIEDLITVKEEYFEAFYNPLVEKYGSLDNYIEEVFHFEPSQIKRFREYCLEQKDEDNYMS